MDAGCVYGRDGDGGADIEVMVRVSSKKERGEERSVMMVNSSSWRGLPIDGKWQLHHGTTIRIQLQHTHT